MRSLTMPTLLCFSLLVSVTSSRAQNNQPFPMVTAGQSIQAALDAQSRGTAHRAVWLVV